MAAAIEVAAGATRIQLFPIGTWTGRNGLGPYTLTDRAHAQAVIDATNAAQASTDLMIDYDHQAVNAPKVAGTAIAAGWVRQLHAQDDGIWADVEWTAKASSHLESREYRYASPYFLHDRAGRITRIINAALTNTPNFNLEAVAASVLTGDDMTLPAILVAALGLGADATAEQAVASINTLKADSTALSATASALGLAAGTAADQVAAAATSLKASAGNVDPTKFVPIEQLQHVNSQLERINGDRAEAAVASAIQSGKLAPALKDWGLGEFKRDEAAFASFLAAAPAILAPGAQSPKIDPKSDTITPEERAAASALGLTDAQYLAARKED